MRFHVWLSPFLRLLCPELLPSQVTVLMGQPVGGEDLSPLTGQACCLGLELRLEGELVETRGIVRIEVANYSEVSTAEFSTAVPQREDEAGCVADVVGFRTELHVHALGHREVLEERQIHVTKVGTEERVARRIANFPGRLRCEGGDVEELGLRPVSTRVEQSVGTISAAAVIRHSPVRVG